MQLQVTLVPSFAASTLLRLKVLNHKEHTLKYKVLPKRAMKEGSDDASDKPLEHAFKKNPQRKLWCSEMK